MVTLLLRVRSTPDGYKKMDMKIYVLYVCVLVVHFRFIETNQRNVRELQ